MTKVLVTQSKLDTLAEIIGGKSNTNVPLTVDEMITAADSITGGGGGITPTGNIDITGAGVTDVTNYATATLPVATYSLGVESNFYTENGVRKWRRRPFIILDSSEGDTEGWIGDGTDYGNYASINAIASGTTVTPTESSQTIGGSSYMMEGAVTVNPIPSQYIVPSGTYNVTSSGTKDVTNYASASVPSGSATPAASISATGATVSTSTNTLTLTKSSVSNTPQVSAGYISSGTAGNSSVSLSATVTTKGATTYTPTTSNQTIASGTYLTGTQTISGDANLVAGNIKSGTSIFGVTGTYTGGGGGDEKNIQIVQNNSTRITATSYTKACGTITVSKAGTYDIYWDAYRTSTSGTWGTQWYKNGTAQGTAQTTFTNSYYQAIHLTNITLAKNDTIDVYGRSRGNGYYLYVGTVIIKEV